LLTDDGARDDTGGVSEAARLWHVKVTVAGPDAEPFVVRRALQRLAEERPFLASLRYGSDRAELCYWEQADTVVDAGSLALRLWNEHKVSAGLPPWEVVGLEVRERDLVNSDALLDNITDLGIVPLLF
jgi:hypothetical protein